jgi:flagellar biosynthesis/type III secretory pathway protein FliH
MSYIAFFRSEKWTLATDDVVITQSEIPLLSTATALVEKIEALGKEETFRIQAAVEKACQEARSQGYEEGLNAAKAQTAVSLANALEGMTQQIATDRQNLHHALETLTMLIVKLVLADLPSKTVLGGLVRRALKSVSGEASVLVKVHPEMIEPIQAALAEFSSPHSMTFEGDASLDILGCSVVTPTGHLLAGLEEQLTLVNAALRNAHAKS